MHSNQRIIHIESKFLDPIAKLLYHDREINRVKYFRDRDKIVLKIEIGIK